MIYNIDNNKKIPINVLYLIARLNPQFLLIWPVSHHTSCPTKSHPYKPPGATLI